MCIIDFWGLNLAYPESPVFPLVNRVMAYLLMGQLFLPAEMVSDLSETAFLFCET